MDGRRHASSDGRGAGVLNEQPLGTDRLGERADAAGHHADPQPGEHAVFSGANTDDDSAG